MERGELIAVVAGALFTAFVLGFVANWLIGRIGGTSRHGPDELDAMAEALHRAEEARDAALAEKAAMEAEAQHHFAQMRAELQATMDGLRAARAENERLRQSGGG